MDRLEYYVLLGGSFFLGLVPMIFISLLQRKQEVVELTHEQKGHILELGEDQRRSDVLIILACGIHFLTVLLLEIIPRDVYNPFDSVHILVPLTFILMIGLIAYSIYKSSKYWVGTLKKNDFSHTFIVVQEKHHTKILLGFGITGIIFLIGWFAVDKIELLKIILSMRQ